MDVTAYMAASLCKGGELPAGFEERLQKEWAFETYEWNTMSQYDHQVVGITFAGCDYIAAGHNKSEVALNISKAVWELNGSWCPVDVRATYLDDQPCEEYSFTEEKYAKVMGGDP